MGFMPIVMMNWRMHWQFSPIRWYHQWQRILPYFISRHIVHCWNWTACRLTSHDDFMETMGTCPDCSFELPDAKEREHQFWETADAAMHEQRADRIAEDMRADETNS